MSKSLDEIAGEIMSEMEKLLLERVYIAIIKEGSVLYASSALDKHIELIKLYAITEYKQMKQFAHAFPLSGTNLAIFKLPDEVLIALYTKKGYQGQLLSFKTKMLTISNDLKTLAEKPDQKPMELELKGQILPKMTQTVSLTLGLSDDESSVLKLCDGNHSIEEIMTKTRLPRMNVIDVVRHFENKGWLKLDFKGEIEITPVSIKKFPETAVRLGMISKKSYDINELCDGTNTIQEVAKKLIMPERELNKILLKMEKNKIIKMSVKIPDELPSISGVPSEEVAVTRPEFVANPELLVKPILTANVSFSMGFDKKEEKILKLLDGAHSITDLYNVTRIPYIDIFKIIIKYEDKGWIRIPIDDFMKIVAIKEKLKSDLRTKELQEEYRTLMGEPEVISEPATLVAEESSAVDNILEKGALLQRIQENLPLMPPATQAKLVDKLIKVLPSSRESMLDKLFNSESSKKFKKPIKPVSPPSVPTPPPSPAPSSGPTIDETPLLQPSKLLGTEASPIPVSKTQSKPLLSPKIPKLPSAVEPKIPKEADIEVAVQPTSSGASFKTKSLSAEAVGEEDQVTDVLNFIDSLLGIPEILYLALIDYGGTIFYQTTKEAELWDISRDTLKLIQNWNAQAPSVYLGGDIKYAVIKTEPEILIATNIKGFGHIVTIPINDKLFILTKVSKEGDALLIADDVAIVAKQINEMFQYNQ